MTTIFSVLDVEKTYQVGLGPRAGLFKPRAPRLLKALNGVRLEVAEGDSIALVGESGSGKSTLVRLMLGLEAASDGRVLYRNADINSFDEQARRQFSRDVAFIYQDARGSMNPRMKIRDVLAEPLLLHGLCTESEADQRVLDLLAKVGLSADMAWRYPAELSGGQVRRVAVARALAAEPKVIIADESVAGLDVSVQAQLLNLLRKLCREMGLTLVFITHDLGVASYLCRRVAVMYLGRIVEEGSTEDILHQPRHPYTRGLMRAFPSFGRPLTASLKGEIPSPIDLPRGCRFASRCQDARDECRELDPVLTSDGQTRRVACLFPLTYSATVQEGGAQHVATGSPVAMAPAAVAR
ncbi:ABC transporter ATP-binding protein [Lacisediminimonas profundi]|uniref:ABC transporter ATP-binding protein n=1 Tax=Lacisediminimonas profundi TaxID=2603856 RepID=UPI00124B6035|nr:ABC transporter ATP-binding protein [Lacisediminimonas profundi]